MLNLIGRRLYFDKNTGQIIVDTGEYKSFGTKPTVEEDIETYIELSKRNRDSFDYIDLEYGQYEEDFRICSAYRINPETKQLEFSYPDPNATEPQEPVYQKPLTEQLKETQQAVAELTLLLSTMTGGM
ncbi:hypothetical protein AP057_08885 [Geobacillus sp. Sah69]|uniref:hypothetical protein n=2 Tax=Geobacillus sp. Sah69 TaxID=1737624 RepID=UPI0006DCCCEF|nr:hypothetical protein [Geobacillus sp. Sah69]KQC46933.1 hypothetical protein AP057_08885 [Geobacillus sp. Sah69]